MKTWFKWVLIVIFSFFGLTMLMVILIPKEKDPKEAAKSSVKVDSVKIKPVKQSFDYHTTREVKDIVNFDSRQLFERLTAEDKTIFTEDISYLSELAGIDIRMNSIELYCSLIDEAETRSYPGMPELVAKFSNDLKKAQIKEFPILRKKYQGAVNKIMFEYNLECKTSKPPHKAIWLICDVFSDNKEIKDMMDKIVQITSSLRFKSVYLKTSYDDFAIRYKLNDPGDDSITPYNSTFDLTPEKVRANE